MIANMMEMIQAWGDDNHTILRHDFQRAPCLPHDLPNGFGAVYRFSLGSGAVLKVGMAEQQCPIPIAPLRP
jgi:hypothetical protein